MSETREIRNRRIAIEAIDLIQDALRHDSLGLLEIEFGQFRARWTERGVPWLLPGGHFDPDEWLPAAEISTRADVEAATVRRWHLRGHITATMLDGRMHYNVGEVVTYLAKRDQTRRSGL